MKSQRAVIVGGGIAGLATANLLAQDGWKVTVLEQREQLGGRAGLLEVDGFTFDTGPSWYLMRDVFKHYYQLLGQNVAHHLDLVRLDPAYQVFADGLEKPVVIRSEIDKITATFEALEQGAGQKIRTYLGRSEKIYNASVQDFLYTNFDRPTDLLKPSLLRRLPVKALTMNLHSYVSRQFKHPVLQKILEYPAVFLAVSPYKAPAIYSLMSHLDMQEGVFYPRGGMYEIIKSFVKIGSDLGVTYKTSASVTSIDIDDNRAHGVTLASSEKLPADVVISATDLHHTEQKLLEKQYRTKSDRYWRRAKPGPSALLLYLGVKGRVPELQHHNLLFTDDWPANFRSVFGGTDWPHPASVYVSAPSRTDPTVAPADHENLFVLVPLPAGVMLSPEEETKHADQYLEQIAKTIGVPDLRDRIVVRRSFGPTDFAEQLNAWQGSALGLGHNLFQSAMFRPGVRSKVPNLFYTGTNIRPGVGLPMCLISAELTYTASKELL